MRRPMLATLLAALLAASATPSLAEDLPTRTLTLALADDPDMLDPTLARTYASRIVFAGLCDKLFDLDEKLAIVPQLALSHEYLTPTELLIRLRPGVLFQDGTKLDGAAVADSLKRHLTLPGSTRRAEIGALDRVDVLDPLTVKLVLRSPSAPLLSSASSPTAPA